MASRAAPWTTPLMMLTLLVGCSASGEHPQLIVGAASSLEPLFEELIPLFEERHQVDVTLTLGASGTLAQQIEQGAPIDVFASADTRFIDRLEQDGHIVGSSKHTFGKGRLAMVTSSETPFGPSSGPTEADFVEAQKAYLTGVERLAIANPEVAPYGAAARAFLLALGIWEEVQPRLVFGENVLQVLQFVESGNVDAGLVSFSFAAGRPLRSVEVHPVAEPTGAPNAFLDQTAAVVTSSAHPETAQRFVDFLSSEAAKEAIERHGYGSVLGPASRRAR